MTFYLGKMTCRFKELRCKMRQQTVGWSLVMLVVLQVALPALALPAEAQGRKFAVKPNDKKKVTAESNEITVIICISFE